jgi:hypothetical protein
MIQVKRVVVVTTLIAEVAVMAAYLTAKPGYAATYLQVNRAARYLQGVRAELG